MADWNSSLSKSGGFRGISMRDDQDFDEEDVWGFVKERGKSKDQYLYSSGSSSSSWKQTTTTARMIPKASTPVEHEAKKMVKQSSAPLDIPDWSKIYGKNTRMGFWVDNNAADYDDIDHHGVDDGVNDDGGDDDDDDGMIPPHEWIARKLARTQISSFSVCEGVGRTLKGRDLSKVRNAILTKTGFLE